jgi:hypothetical protein
MSAMTEDEARERFGDAAEGTLGEAKEAFEAALAEHATLREEYELYKKMIGGAHALGDEDASDAAPPPALLEGVQRKIRTRSKGRFYRDRFASEGKGPMLSLVLAMAILLLVATTIVIVQQLVVVELP